MYKKVLTLITVLFLVAGCADEESTTTYSRPSKGPFAKYASNDTWQSAASADAANEKYDNVFYFDFDSSRLDANKRQHLNRLAASLLKNPQHKVRIEGHADERGSHEYNIGLGERRAKSLKENMINLGVRADQVELVSYGKEKPAAQGHSEDAWRLNRRAEIREEG